MNFGTIVRIAAILLGIASTTLMATKAFAFQFNNDFMAMLDIIRDFVGFIVRPFELLLITPVVKWLHDYGFVFTLHEHWRNTFVLLWLFFAAFARGTLIGIKPPSVSQLWSHPNRVARFWIWRMREWFWSATWALFGGVLAGTAPLDHQGVFWWPVASVGLRFASYEATRGASQWVGWTRFVRNLAPVAISFGLLLTLLGAALWAVAVLTEPNANIFPPRVPFPTSPSPGLVSLAGFVAIWGIWYLFPFEGLRAEWINDPNTHIGLDILSVLGGAATVVYLAHLMA